MPKRVYNNTPSHTEVNTAQKNQINAGMEGLRTSILQRIDRINTIREQSPNAFGTYRAGREAEQQVTGEFHSLQQSLYGASQSVGYTSDDVRNVMDRAEAVERNNGDVIGRNHGANEPRPVNTGGTPELNNDANLGGGNNLGGRRP